MDRPIIFSAPMVRALLDGRKTQTRRIVKTQMHHTRVESITHWEGRDWLAIDENGGSLVRPHYAPGVRLWVREVWRPQMDDELWCCVEYRADGARIKPRIEDDNDGENFAHACDLVDPDWRKWGDEPEPARWRSPIHMPRWASRITLHVTDVRVQRLHEITPADAIAEGIPPAANSLTVDCDTPSPCDGFCSLWNSIHGPDAWDANPWVAAVTFAVHKCNIDQMAG